MPARNCRTAPVFISERYVEEKAGKSERNLLWTRLRFAILLLLFAALSARPTVAQSSDSPAQSQSGEVQELRKEVNELREDLKRLEAMLEGKKALGTATIVTPPAQPTASVQPATQAPSISEQVRQAAAEDKGLPLYTGRSDDPQVAMATKAHGGDLSGAGNLLRTDRVTIGGYGDFQYRTPALNERADGGGTSTFQSTRFVLGVAAVLSQKQNITFNSEIEYELGTHEIDVEQAFISWRVRPEFDFRGGIIVPPLGRFNTYHDSNLNITTLRPLINQFIVLRTIQIFHHRMNGISLNKKSRTLFR